MKELGFIGCGNMARAMMEGLLKTNRFSPEDFIVSDKSEEALSRISDELKIGCTTTDNHQVVKEAKTVIFAVKPQVFPCVAEELKDCIDSDKLVVSIVAGKSTENIQSFSKNPLKIVRIMPNTPALVGEGMAGICSNSLVSGEELQYVKSLFESFGKAEIVSEHLMDAVVGVSGSAPAYVFMFIEAMADAAVAEGMPRQQAYTFAAQTVLGSAKMVLETGKHPGELKDMVCSPAGTTIEAVRVLEEKGMRSAVFEAVKACSEMSKKL